MAKNRYFILIVGLLVHESSAFLLRSTVCTQKLQDGERLVREKEDEKEKDTEER
jgi:hypothetical protein